MGGTPIKLWASTKERIDKLQASLQDYLCKVMGSCPPAGVPKTIIIDTLVRFCLNKDPDTLFRGTSNWLEKKGNDVKGRLVSIRILDETKKGLDELREKIIEVFLNKAQDLGLYDFQPDDLRESLRLVLSYTNLFGIILEIFKPEEFTEEVTNAVGRGTKLSPPFYRFANMIIEKMGKSIAFKDPYTKVMHFLKKVEEEEPKKRRAEAIIRRGKELLKELSNKPIKGKLRMGFLGDNLVALPLEEELLEQLSIIVRAALKGRFDVPLDISFSLGGKEFHFKGADEVELVEMETYSFEYWGLPIKWTSKNIPAIWIKRDLELMQLVKQNADVNATIYFHYK